MKIIIITDPEKRADEGLMVENLFNQGLETLHLRKPEMPIDEFEICLKAISPKYYKQIVIHSHYKLIEKYNLKGIHLTESYRKATVGLEELVKFVQKKGLSISTSIHSLEDLTNMNVLFDYVFISPVFDSISKEEYNANINLTGLKEALKNKKVEIPVFALGGIKVSNLTEIRVSGVDGVALLGAIWNTDNPLRAFTNIQRELKK